MYICLKGKTAKIIEDYKVLVGEVMYGSQA
jgi:hypothetical protein